MRIIAHAMQLDILQQTTSENNETNDWPQMFSTLFNIHPFVYSEFPYFAKIFSNYFASNLLYAGEVKRQYYISGFF